MKTRRRFLEESAAAAAGITTGVVTPLIAADTEQAITMKKQRPRRGLVTWYSQTGYTRRIGRLIAKVWQKQGLAVDAGDYRDLGEVQPGSYDIIAAGSPVYYYESPANFREWLQTLTVSEGTPVAAFVTCGGEGGNQHNTACDIIEALSSRGGVPAGMLIANNMSAYAPTWSMGNRERVLKYRHLPDEATYGRVRGFSALLLERAERGESEDIRRERTISDLVRGGTSIRFSKFMTSDHHIDQETCIGCGTCERVCPIRAVNADKGTIDSARCLACLGCVNNCPAGAMTMKFMGKKVYGYLEFKKREGLIIKEPAELSG